MIIFPNNISESIWRSHFRTYSHTLFEYFENYSPILSLEIKILSTNSLYICPLCTKTYFAESSQGIIGNSEFSLDHLPPKSVGGKFKIITCKKCNNKSGEYEAELVKLLDFGTEPDKKYKSILPKMTVMNKETGEEFFASVQVNDGKPDIKFNEEAKKYDSRLKKFLEELNSGKIKKLQLNAPFPDLKKIQKALLKSAYLTCFTWWGYEFVYSKNGEMIRKVLNDELEYPTRVPTIWRETKKIDLPLGVAIISKDKIRQSFLVSLELVGSRGNFVAAIMIPNPTPDGWSKLFKLDIYAKGKTLTEFEGLSIPRTIIRNGYTIAWNIISWGR